MRGEVLSAARAAALAARWYAGRLGRDWRPRTPAETNALFGSLGLAGPFWRV